VLTHIFAKKNFFVVFKKYIVSYSHSILYGKLLKNKEN